MTTLTSLSTLPAMDASAPLGIRTTIDGMCSKESGIESNSTFMRSLIAPEGARINQI